MRSHFSPLHLLALLLALFTCAMASAPSFAEAPPPVIRFGGPGGSKQDQKMWGLLEIARAKGFFAAEFKAEGTKIETTGFNTVPMVGEALATGAIDFAGQGELIALLTHAAGTRTRLLMPVSRFENAYVIVPRESTAKSWADLKGRKVAYSKGAYIHIQTLRILKNQGLSEGDIKPVNLDAASGATVLTSNGIDALLAGFQYALPMRNRDIGRILYDTRNAPTETAQTGLIVREAFVQQYPETVQRIVRAMVRAARWASDPANREEVISLWVWGTSRELDDVREDVGPGPLLIRVSPLLDGFVRSQYRNTQENAVAARLLRRPVDLDQWIDGSFLEKAIREEGLEGFWPDLDAHGKALAKEASQ